MKHRFRSLLCFGAVCFLPIGSSLISALNPGVAYASDGSNLDYNVNLQINDKPVVFPDAQPFIDENSRTQVPIRFVSESLGYQTQWESQGGQIRVTFKKDAQSIVLTTGDSHALVNGTSVLLESQPLLMQDRAYVPIRFVSEIMGYSVQWNGNQEVAVISTDGKTHTALTFPKKAAPAPSLREKITSAAKTYVGTPYVWGGTSPAGFDCSGFLQYVYSKYGVSLPRTASDMFASVGVGTSEPQIGDLVFFTTYDSGASHAGIYLGNQQFISATSSKGVQIDSFNNVYWGPRYLGAKHLSL